MKVEAPHESLHHVAPCSHVSHLLKWAHELRSMQSVALLVLPLMP
jgi:hypothetical protein